jgi:hypothetical protein
VRCDARYIEADTKGSRSSWNSSNDWRDNITSSVSPVATYLPNNYFPVCSTLLWTIISPVVTHETHTIIDPDPQAITSFDHLFLHVDYFGLIYQCSNKTTRQPEEIHLDLSIRPILPTIPSVLHKRSPIVCVCLCPQILYYTPRLPDIKLQDTSPYIFCCVNRAGASHT